MNLTPIKVKGRGRKKAWQPPDPSRIKSNRKRGDDEDDHDNVKSDSSRSSKRSKKSDAKPTGILDLPTELIWPIAVMSRNSNLMRTNRKIRDVLSAKSFLLELVVAAFRPTWEAFFGRPKRSIDSSEYKRKDREEFPGDAQFQSDVLASRWINIDLLLEAQQMWYRQDGAKRCWDKAPCIWWTRTIQAQEDEEGQQAEEGNHTKDKQQEEPTSVPEIKDWFDQDWQEFCEACSYDEKTRAYREIAMNVVSDTTKGYLDLNRWTTIPDRLLKGPFDLEKTKLLFWLVRGGARILKQEHNWEVTKLGFEQIMALEDNITLGPYLIYFYHVLGVFDDGHWPDFLLEEKLEWLQAMKLELPVHTHNLLDFRLRLYNFAMNFLGTHQNGRVAAELGRVAAEFEASMTRRQ